MSKLLFSILFLTGSISLASPNKLNFKGESKFKKNTYTVSMELNKENESPNKTSYRGSITLGVPGHSTIKDILFEVYNKHNTAVGIVQLSGNPLIGEELNLSGNLKSSDFKIGDTLNLNTEYIQVKSIVAAADSNKVHSQNKSLDSGVTKLTVIE